MVNSMKKKQIIVSLREELDAMRRRAESAERKLFGEPIWVDADGEEYNRDYCYCLSEAVNGWPHSDVSFPAGTPVCFSRSYFVNTRKARVVIQFGKPLEVDRETQRPLGGQLTWDFILSPDSDNWRDRRLIVPVRKVKAEAGKED